jgi:Subtilase family
MEIGVAGLCLLVLLLGCAGGRAGSPTLSEEGEGGGKGLFLPPSKNGCYVATVGKRLTDSEKGKYADVLEKGGFGLSFFLDELVAGLAFCADPGKKQDPEMLRDMPFLSLEADLSYTLASVQTVLPDNFYVERNLTRRYTGIREIDLFIDSYILNSYLLRSLATSSPLKGLFWRHSFQTPGKGVDVFIVDGKAPEHTEVSGRMALLFEGESDAEAAGHAIAMATLVAGKYAGLAKHAEIFVIPAFRTREESLSEIVLSLEKIVLNRRERATLALLPFYGPRSEIMDAFVRALYSRGVYVVAPAGNKGGSSCSNSPGGSLYAITVGSINDSGNLSFFSARGECMDMVAVGEGVTVGSVRGKSLYEEKSGTSVAAAYVAGVAAITLGRGTLPLQDLKEAISVEGMAIFPQEAGAGEEIEPTFRYVNRKTKRGLWWFLVRSALLVGVAVTLCTYLRGQKPAIPRARRRASPPRFQ